MLKNIHPVEQEDLMAYLDGELTVDRAATAAAHLENCRECQELAADLQSVSRRMLAWQVEPSDFQMKQDIATAFKEREQTRTPRRGMRRWQWGLAGAGVVVLSACVMVVLLQQTDRYQFAKFSASKLRVSAMLSGPPIIARTAQLTLSTTEFDKTRPALDDILKRHQGYFGELNINAPTGLGRTLEAILRVPADQRDATIAELKKLGRVESESQTGEEVTAEYVDREARLSNARNTEQRLTELLRQRTGKLSDVLAVELEIGRVRGEIERMQAEQKSLVKRVDFATLNVKITEDYKAQLQVMPDSILGRFRNSGISGYRSMVEGIVAVVAFLLSAGPSLLLVSAVLFFPLRFVWKKRRRESVR
jgi:hypothetical protein